MAEQRGSGRAHSKRNTGRLRVCVGGGGQQVVLGLGWHGATPMGFARRATGRSREGDGELGIRETCADGRAPLDREREGGIGPLACGPEGVQVGSGRQDGASWLWVRPIKIKRILEIR
jgi:hypothetical protein